MSDSNCPISATVEDSGSAEEHKETAMSFIYNTIGRCSVKSEMHGATLLLPRHRAQCGVRCPAGHARDQSRPRRVVNPGLSARPRVRLAAGPMAR
eukprot:125420-Hanusia_phi.AAC.1